MYTLLLADDEPKTRLAIRELVDWRSMGFDEVHEANNGEQAIAIACRVRADVVLLDIRMPDMDGLEVARRITAALKDAKIIFVTAYEELDLLRQALRLHAVDYVLKPVRRNQLVQSVRDALELLENQLQAQAMSQLVARERDLLRSRALRRLVTGNTGSADAQSMERLLGVDSQRRPTFGLYLLQLSAENQREQTIAVLNRYIDRQLPAHFANAWIVSIEAMEIALIATSGEQKSGHVADELRTALAEESGDPVVVSATDWVERIEQLASAYEGLKLELEFSDTQRSPLVVTHRPQDEKVAQEIKRIVRAKFMEEDLTIRGMAFEMGYSSAYLCMAFKRTAGITINDYIHLCRIHEAKEMMRETDQNLYDIAYEVGYSSENYFAKVFRKYEGLTPSWYREHCSDP